MKETISKRDWETISAYLDGQLSQRKQARLENRLQNDHQLQDAYHELRNTRNILRSAPSLRVPRNFMLTLEMAGNPTRMPRLAPVFGWASAVASFLLVLVLVGDIFSAGGFVPIPYNLSQQSEFVAPRSQIAESDALGQPVITEELSVALKASVDSVEEDVPPEVQDEVAPMDMAAESALESAPTEEEIAELQEIEESAASAEAAPDQPEGRAAVTTQGDATFGAPSDADSATPSDGTMDGSGEPQVEFETMEGVANLVDSTAIPETDENESVLEQPTEIPVAEETSTQPQEDQVKQPASDVTETPMIAESKAIQVEQPAAVDIVETTLAEELPLVVTGLDLVATPAEVPVSVKTRDIVYGVEMILALSALGTGLAWVYMRRRAG